MSESVEAKCQELDEARKARDEAGVVGATVPATIRFLASQLDKAEKENISLRLKANQP